MLHDQGEGYQQTKLLEVGVAQVVKEVFHFQIPYWDQNSINLLVIGPIPFLGLDLIDPRSSYFYLYLDIELFGEISMRKFLNRPDSEL